MVTDFVEILAIFGQFSEVPECSEINTLAASRKLVQLEFAVII